MNRTAFLNQIKNAKSAGALSRTYWIAVAHDYERAEIVGEILRLIPEGEKNVQKWTEFNAVALADHLQTPNLFGEEPVAWVDNAESMGKGEEAPFPKDFGYLILSAKSKSSWSEKVESVGVVLDLLAEKPWEKEKRIQQTLEQFVHRAGKTIAPMALNLLMESQDLEEGILEREIEKLVCYSGDRLQITVNDVETICKPNKAFGVWQTAELAIWEGKGVLEEAHFHALIPALRSQLQLGLKIATLIAENASREEWTVALPKVFPKTLEKRTRDAERLGVHYFRRGLELLFDIELQSRMGSQHLGALLDLFRCTLYAGMP